ncbi:hypothetical protein WHZ78_09640 [Bradyrhizobium symbiodeficiens]|uniref:hypothetical protein n=1 Tax=Bradyrhizobium symbiodeficiens TaxID=1404367 RepID=UPI0030D0C999
MLEVAEIISEAVKLVERAQSKEDVSPRIDVSPDLTPIRGDRIQQQRCWSTSWSMPAKPWRVRADLASSPCVQTLQAATRLSWL